MLKTFHQAQIIRPAEFYHRISRIRDINKRNLVRGLSSKSNITTNDVDYVRRSNSVHDSMVVGSLLKGPYGLLNEGKEVIKWSCDDIFKMTPYQPISWRCEISYTAGYVNSVFRMALDILSLMKPLSMLDTVDSDCALELIKTLSIKYGASNYLSYKLAYLRSVRELTAEQLGVVSQIEDEIQHRKNGGLHFNAIENISSKVPLFLVTKRRVSGLAGKVDANFRKAISLSNYIPTPLDYDDIPAFLLRASESSLTDTLYALITILNLEKSFELAGQEIKKFLSPLIYKNLLEIKKYASKQNSRKLVTEHYKAQAESIYPSLDIYRLSSVFLENEDYAIYRNKFDKIIGSRLLSEIIGYRNYEISESSITKEIIISKECSIIGEPVPLTLDIFYRTFLFLNFIKNKNNILDISKEDIKFLFEHTVNLEMLLTDEELEALYTTSNPESKSLIAVLALALYRQKSIDPDIDFEFRTDFISHVNENHGGSILNFINYLLSDSPEVASYIVGSLDEVTLEKLYTLVRGASEASSIRGEILRAVGHRVNRIEYIIEADAIMTRSKVSKLQKYFDSSRIYIDSVAMQKWLDSNPTASTEQYRAIYPTISSFDSLGAGSLLARLTEQYDHLVIQIAKDAFEQFCLNTEFGIESYLGRRIRHNTLDGVTTDTVYAVLRKPSFSILLANNSTRKTVDTWMQAYKSIIDKLRQYHLQFKSTTSLFKSTLDLNDSTTKDNVRKLSNSLKSINAVELLNEFVIAFCWKQITPQLENAARFIRTTLLLEANSSIDKFFTGHGHVEEQLKTELHEAVNEVFKKIADWFQVPQTGFISASVKDLCQIILIDLNRSNVDFKGDALENKYTGISVHRLYDCLAVLLQNAHKHGQDNHPLIIMVNALQPSEDSIYDVVYVQVASTVEIDHYCTAKERIYSAIESVETGVDMVTEGYTGIKKIKFITRASEGYHTIKCIADDDSRELRLCFSLHSERATDNSLGGDAQ